MCDANASFGLRHAACLGSECDDLIRSRHKAQKEREIQVIN